MRSDDTPITDLETAQGPTQPTMDFARAMTNAADQAAESDATRAISRNHPPSSPDTVDRRVEPDRKADGTLVRYFGDYELLSEIARGGMGVVYRARQLSLNRTVAVKMILAGEFASEAAVRRFHLEAQSAANLMHPAIVPIYEIGESAGHHFFSMGFVDGESIQQKLRNGPLPPRDAAGLIKRVAEAIEYAHKQGVIHRDLKPANILLDRAGEPQVTDFGLAKLLDSKDELTATGQAMGTPSYMPPEQVASKTSELGPAADIYSLGATLYAMLVGRPPFQAASAIDTMIQVLNQEPVAPRTLNPEVDRDLETICLKCLSKEPRRRYGSAAAVADELGRYLAGQPIAARPVGPFERSWRWCRRNPAVAALWTGLAASLVIGTATAAFLAVRARASANAAIAEGGRANKSAAEAIAERKLANDRAAEALASAKRADASARDARAAQSRADASAEQARRNVYFARITLAQIALDNTNANRATELLESLVPSAGETDLRGWDWNFLNRSAHDELRLFPGGNGRSDMAVFRPSGDELAAGGVDGFIRIWNVAEGRLVHQIDGHAGEVNSLAYHPNGQLLGSAGADSAVRLWNAQTGVLVRALARLGSDAQNVAFSPDGKSIAATCADGSIHHFSTLDDRLLWRKPGAGFNHEWYDSLSFSPDGRLLATSAGTFNEIRVWNVADGRLLRTLSGHTDQVRGPEFLKDRHRFVTASHDRTLRIWNVDTGETLHVLTGHTSWIEGLGVSSDGKMIASAGADGTVRTWDAQSGRELAVFVGHTRSVRSAAFSPDGRTIASASNDGSTRLWDSTGALAVQNFSAGGGSKAIAIAFTRDGSLLASAHEDGTIQIRDARAGLLTRLIDARGAPAPSLAFDRRGNRLAAAGPDPAVRIWDLRDGRLVESRTHAGSGSRLIAFSPNGDRVVTTADNGLVTLHDLSAGRPATVLRGMPLLAFAPQVNKVAGLAFSPDGRRLLAARTHSWLNLWDTQSLQRFKDIEVRLGYLAPPAISPDGRRIAVAGGSNEDSEVAVLDADSGEVVQRLKGHSFPISAVTFSPDGRRIVTGSWDRLIKVWDAGSGQELLSLKGHFDSVTMLEFGHGGRRLASLDRAGTIILWDSHALDTPENRAEREAIGLIRHLKLNSSSPDDFKAAVRHTGALSDRARTKALEFAEIALRADTEARADALVNRMAAVSGDDRDVTFAICAEPVPERIRTRALEMAARLDDDPRRFTRRDPENDPREYPNAGQAAYAWASRAGRLLPSDGNCQHILGFAAFRAGHIDEALAAFRRAATLNHNQPSDLAAIAIVQFKRGALSEARSALAQARSAMKSPRFSTDELARNLIKTAQDLDDQSKH